MPDDPNKIVSVNQWFLKKPAPAVPIPPFVPTGLTDATATLVGFVTDADLETLGTDAPFDPPDDAQPDHVV